MSNRRSTATAAATEDRKQRSNRPATDYVAGRGVTVAERQAEADGIAAGAKQRLRLAARDILATCNALRADGREVPPNAYLMPDTDEAGEQLDAREVLREAAQRAKPGRGFGHGENDAAHLTATDVARIGAYGSYCAQRMTRNRMPVADLEEVESSVVLAVLAKGARGVLPRWDALKRADLEGVPTDVDTLRGTWRGFGYLEARRAVGEWRAKQDAETAADWSEPGEDAPTVEQRAAMASEAAHARLNDGVESSALLTYALAATAPEVLTKDESTALTLATLGCTCKGRHREGCKGVTRADLAAARGVGAEAVKKSAQRGRKTLARLADADPHQWARRADERLARMTFQPSELDRLAALAAAGHGAPYRGVRLSWVDRVATVTPEGEYVIPPAPKGAGTRANVPATGHNPARTWKALPRLTRTGAPGMTDLPRLPYRLADAVRNAPAPLIGPLPRADQPAHRERITTGHPAPSPEIARMARDSARAQERAAQWIFPKQ